MNVFWPLDYRRPQKRIGEDEPSLASSGDWVRVGILHFNFKVNDEMVSPLSSLKVAVPFVMTRHFVNHKIIKKGLGLENYHTKVTTWLQDKPQIYTVPIDICGQI